MQSRAVEAMKEYRVAVLICFLAIQEIFGRRLIRHFDDYEQFSNENFADDYNVEYQDENRASSKVEDESLTNFDDMTCSVSTFSEWLPEHDLEGKVLVITKLNFDSDALEIKT